MTIKEMEELSGMERANIRFYEQEGFITPSRLENGYRDYCEEELTVLLRIKLLRKLAISLEEIKSLKEGNQELIEVLSKQIERLKQSRKTELFAQEICKIMKNDSVKFENLSAFKYLQEIEEQERERGSIHFEIKEETDLQAFQPWKRYIARTFDMFLYNVIATILISLMFQVSILTQSPLLRVCYLALSILITLFLEPLLLHKLGTTLGKFILGIRVESVEGRRLTYDEALDRTWYVLLHGMGFNLPIPGWIYMAKSYQLCMDDKKQEWDADTVYTIKEINWVRIMGMICAYAATGTILVVTAFAQGLPPNRGELTIEQFVENYNYYATLYRNESRRYGSQSEMILKQDGTWELISEQGSISYDSFYQHPPVLTFEMENGSIKSIVSIVNIAKKQEHITDYNEFMVLSSGAFVGAQKQTKLFSKFLIEIDSKIREHSFENFHMNQSDIKIDNEVTMKGYIETIDCLTPYEESPAFYYRQDFTIKK